MTDIHRIKHTDKGIHRGALLLKINLLSKMSRFWNNRVHSLLRTYSHIALSEIKSILIHVQLLVCEGDRVKI